MISRTICEKATMLTYDFFFIFFFQITKKGLMKFHKEIDSKKLVIRKGTILIVPLGPHQVADEQLKQNNANLI